jgi:hypothetical protein
MTDDRLSGSAKNIGGQVEEGFGRVAGDEKNSSRASPSRWRARCKTSTVKPRRLRLMCISRNSIGQLVPG